MYKIKCEALGDFLRACAAMTREGVHFTAFVESLEIELTGGF